MFQASIYVLPRGFCSDSKQMHKWAGPGKAATLGRTMAGRGTKSKKAVERLKGSLAKKKESKRGSRNGMIKTMVNPWESGNTKASGRAAGVTRLMR